MPRHSYAADMIATIRHYADAAADFAAIARQRPLPAMKLPLR
jgi:hypothetical protein